MKKILLPFLLGGIFSASNAENTVFVESVKMEQNVDIESEDCATLSIQLSAENSFTSVSFYLAIPQGLAFNPGYRYPGELLPSTNKKGVITYAHTIDVQEVEPTSEYNVPGYTVYQIYIYTASETYFSDKNGELLSFDLGSSQVSNIYPIYLQDVVLAYDANPENAAKTAWSTSYVVVGDDAQGSLPVRGILPSSVTANLNNEGSITSLDLTKCTQVNGTLDLKDGRDLIIDSDVPATATKATYTRAGNDYQWGTLCVPFAFSTEGDVKYYTLSSVEGEKMVFTSIDESPIAAGTPVVFKRAKNAPLSIASEENTSLTNPVEGAIANALITTGSFVKTTAAGYYIAQDKFWPGTNFQVPAFRSYFAGSPSQASYRIVVDDEAAGISELEMDENGNLHEVYNLQGQHIAAPINGQVNIIDGKKAIMK